MSKSKSRKKKPPKRVLALPDLEHAKTAVLNSLTSASGQRTYDQRFASSSPGTVRSPASRSTAPSCSGTAFTSNNANMRRHDQSSARRRPADRVRGGRRRPPESRIGGRYSAREGSATDRRAPGELADARAGPAAS